MAGPWYGIPFVAVVNPKQADELSPRLRLCILARIQRYRTGAAELTNRTKSSCPVSDFALVQHPLNSDALMVHTTRVRGASCNMLRHDTRPPLTTRDVIRSVTKRKVMKEPRYREGCMRCAYTVDDQPYVQLMLVRRILLGVGENGWHEILAGARQLGSYEAFSSRLSGSQEGMTGGLSKGIRKLDIGHYIRAEINQDATEMSIRWTLTGDLRLHGHFLPIALALASYARLGELVGGTAEAGHACGALLPGFVTVRALHSTNHQLSDDSQYGNR